MHSFLGLTRETSDGFRTIATGHLAKAKYDLLQTFANYLDMKKRLADRRASAIIRIAPAPGTQLLVAATVLMTGYEGDLAAIDMILRAAEKIVEDFETNRAAEFDAELVCNYRELLAQLRRQAQERIDLIDLDLLQEIGTQYAALNIVP